jgi:DNA replication and repair protein RecF
VERLEPFIVQSFATISDRSEPLAVGYQPGSTEHFEKALHDTQGEELRLRMTLIGPHRDDFAMTLYSEPAEIFASEGQQRTIAIALKLAQAKLLALDFKTPPILLLDDVFGELDVARRNRLFAALPIQGQRLVTTTHLDWLAEIPAGRLYRIREDSDGQRHLEPG